MNIDFTIPTVILIKKWDGYGARFSLLEHVYDLYRKEKEYLKQIFSK